MCSPAEYLMHKAAAGVSVVRKTKEVADEKGAVSVEADVDAVVVTPQVFCPVTGVKKAGAPVEFSISGMKKDRANLVKAIADLDAMLKDLEAA